MIRQIAKALAISLFLSTPVFAEEVQISNTEVENENHV